MASITSFLRKHNLIYTTCKLATEKTALNRWVKEAGEGNQNAYKELYMRYANPMFNVCIRMLGNRQEAEDVIQDSFTKAFQNLHQLKEASMFGGWLRRIIINACIQRTSKRIDFRQLSAVYDITEEDDTDLCEAEDFRALHDAMKSLPDGCRQIFILYVTEDYSHKQIGSMLNISESTSKSQYARAKKLLREQLIKGNG